jgi:hypothetical protein
MTEEEVLRQLADATREYQIAQQKMTSLKKKLMHAETELIHAKINKERAAEAKRIFYNTTHPPELDARDKEIKAFKDKYPELCKKEE